MRKILCSSIELYEYHKRCAYYARLGMPKLKETKKKAAINAESLEIESGVESLNFFIIRIKQ